MNPTGIPVFHVTHHVPVVTVRRPPVGYSRVSAQALTAHNFFVRMWEKILGATSSTVNQRREPGIRRCVRHTRSYDAGSEEARMRLMMRFSAVEKGRSKVSVNYRARDKDIRFPPWFVLFEATSRN